MKTFTRFFTLCTALLLMLAFSFSAMAQSSIGPNNPNTAVNDNSYGSVAWSDPSNITSPGSPYATSTIGSGNNSNYLKATNYGFSIPVNANINGIVVNINRQGTQSLSVGVRDKRVRLVKNGTIQSQQDKAQSSTWPTSFAVATYGGATDLWNNTWTAADINNSNFGVVISAHNNSSFSNRTATVDYIQITVHYTVTCTDPDIPNITSSTSICTGDNIELKILTGNLNDATAWHWYSGSCGGIAVGTGTSVSVSPAATTTYYVRGEGGCVTPGSCAQVTITVYPLFTAGVIASTGETICYGGTPSEIGSTTAASGGDGTITYLWFSSTDSYAMAISGATAATYTPPSGLQATTTYRRYANDGTCNTTATQSTGEWTVTVYSEFVVGSISSDQTICYNTTPAKLEGVAPSGGDGSYTYQWQYYDGSTWVNIVNETSLDYTPGQLIATTKYRLAQTSGSGCGTLYTNEVTITVYPAFTAGAIENLGETICYKGTPSEIGSSIDASGGDGNIVYSWRSSADSYATDISGAIAATYTPPPGLESTTIYKRFAKDGTCNTTPEESDVVWEVTVLDWVVHNEDLDLYYCNTQDAISNAIDAANAGDNIKVKSGNYGDLNDTKGLSWHFGASPGCVTIGNATFGSGSTINIEIDALTPTCPDPNPGFDHLNILGNLTLNSPTLTLISGTQFPDASVITIIDVGGTFNGTFAGGTSYFDGTNYWEIDYTSNNVTLTSGSAPIIDCPIDKEEETAAGQCGRQLYYTDGSYTGYPAPSISYVLSGATPGSGSGTGTGVLFNKGVTTVTLTAENIHGTATCSFTVTVEDKEPPKIVYNLIPGCPPDLTVNAVSGTCESDFVNWTAPTASDNCPGVSLVTTHDPHSKFPVGVTQVIYTATDASGNQTSCSFTITVNDVDDPDLTVPVPLASYDADDNVCTATLTFQATATDLCSTPYIEYSLDNFISTLPDSGSPDYELTYAFPVGSTTIYVRAVDGSNNSVTDEFTVVVEDNQDPEITTCPVDDLILTGCSVDDLPVAYPAYSATEVFVASFAGIATDNCGVVSYSYQDVSSGSCPLVVTRTWTVYDAAGNSDECEQVFNITAPALSVAQALSSSKATCDFVNDVAFEEDFDNWLNQPLTVTGGCVSPAVITNDWTGPLPDYCEGGIFTVTWTVEDLCETVSTTAVYTLTKPQPLVIDKPNPKQYSACEFEDQDELDSAFSTWLEEFYALGGCDPQGELVGIDTPTHCDGGTATVYYNVSDNCGEGSVSSVFTVTKAPAVVLEVPDPYAGSVCMTDADILSDFNDWLGTATFTGGCIATWSNDAGNAPDRCGGVVTVTWKVESNCEPDVVKSSTFTIPEAPKVEITIADLTLDKACYNQAEVDQKFTEWVGTATFTGGCNAVWTNDADIAPGYCGGSVIVTWTVTSYCEDVPAVKSATFTVPYPDPVVITTPAPVVKESCEFTSEAEIEDAFQAFLDGFDVSGGCSPSFTLDKDITDAPDWCGGVVTVTATYDGECGTASASSTFKINEPAPLVLKQPNDRTVSTCDFADQQAVNADFANQFISQFEPVSGGCFELPYKMDPFGELTDAATGLPPVAPEYCVGGIRVVQYKVTSGCIEKIVTSTYTLEAPQVAVAGPEIEEYSTCYFADQKALDDAFDAWKAQFKVTNSGCTITSETDLTVYTAPVLCDGGEVFITYTATDKCNHPATVTSSFTVEKPAAVAVEGPGNVVSSTCDFVDQSALDAAFNAWKDGFTVTNPGCGVDTPTFVLTGTVTPTLCESTLVTGVFTAEDMCTTASVTYTFEITAPPAIALLSPDDFDELSCYFENQNDLNQALEDWKDEFKVDGDICGNYIPVITYNPQTPSITLCDGGIVTAVYSLTDLCSTLSVTKTFKVTKPEVVAVEGPGNVVSNTCEFADQEAINDAYSIWLTGFEVIESGCGTTPTFTFNPANEAPALCDGGTVTVVYSLDDLCSSASVTYSFTILPYVAPLVSDPGDKIIPACTHLTQAAMDLEFASWLAGFEVTGGCSPVVTISHTVADAPEFCGGEIVVTMEYSDLCESGSVSRTFRVEEDPLVITKPNAPFTGNACNYETVDEIHDDYKAWLLHFQPSGGCVENTNDYTIWTNITLPGDLEPLLCGGSLDIEYHVIAICGEGMQTSTFTITAPDPFAFDPLVDLNVKSCEFTIQQDVQDAFDNWVSAQTASITTSLTGGCEDATVSNTAASAIIPDICEGGEAVVTWTVEEPLRCLSATASATFTLEKPAPLAFAPLVDLDVKSCEFTIQQDVQDAFDNWVSAQTASITASLTGGCEEATVSNTAASAIIPDICAGGEAVVTWTVEEPAYCLSATASATFKLTEPDAISFDEPQSLAFVSCHFVTQDDLEAEFDDWMDNIWGNIAGGCSPTFSNDWDEEYPDYCEGGIVTVTFYIEDLCETISRTVTFSVEEVPAIVYTDPANISLDACDFKNQAEVDAAFNTWFDSILTDVTGGCAPTVTNTWDGSIPAICAGGEVEITWTIDDRCETIPLTAKFKLTAPAPVTYTLSVKKEVAECAFISGGESDYEAMEADFNAWLQTQTDNINPVGCFTPTVSHNWDGNYPNICGGEVEIMWTITDENQCETITFTATYKINSAPKLVLYKPEKYVASGCDFESEIKLNLAFSTWLTKFEPSGACVIIGNYDTYKPDTDYDVIPSLCGSETVVIYTVTSGCQTEVVSETFTILAPVVTPTIAVVTEKEACEFTDQGDLNTKFNAWLGTFAVDNPGGNCTSYGKILDTPVAPPDLCAGGTVVVEYEYGTTNCGMIGIVTSSYTVIPAQQLAFIDPVAEEVSSCEFTIQQDVEDAFNAWVDAQTLLIAESITGGCGTATVTNDSSSAIIPVLCDGGSVSVIWNIDEPTYCLSATTSATFTLTAPAAVTYTAPESTEEYSCDFDEQSEVDDAFNVWVSEQTEALNLGGGCTPVSTYTWTGDIPALCTGDETEVTWTITDLCEEFTLKATFKLTVPDAITFDDPVNFEESVCKLTDYDVDAAFSSWLAAQTDVIEQSLAGGCSPTVSYEVKDEIPELCDGGVAEVIWTIEDRCDTYTTTATFKVTAPAAITYEVPAGKKVESCDYTSQADIDAAFDTWFTTADAAAIASIGGGCSPTIEHDWIAGNYPDWCGGSVVVTWTVEDLCETVSFTSTFEVEAPAELVLIAPPARTYSACEFDTQTKLNTKFSEWVSLYEVSGGCGEPYDVKLTNAVAPLLCSVEPDNSVVVTYTAVSGCQTVIVSSTFTITPMPVEVDGPDNKSVYACDFTDQEALDKDFADWLEEFEITKDGCGASATDLTGFSAPELCVGGTVTVVYEATDGHSCGYSTTSITRAYTLTIPEAVAVGGPENVDASSCDYANETEFEEAYNTWLGAFEVTESGCGVLTPTKTITGSVTLCKGGEVTVEFSAEDLCTSASITRSFKITAPAEVAVDGPENTTVDACVFADQGTLDTEFAEWLAEFTVVESGCGVITPTLNYFAPDLCEGGTVTVVYGVEDLCTTAEITRTFTLNPRPAVVVEQPEDFSAAACEFDDQDDLDEAFELWLAEFTVSGGCDPIGVATPITAPVLCEGGLIEVSYNVTDICYNETFTAVFEITAPATLVVNTPENVMLSACTFDNKADIDDAFETWLNDFEVTGGCSPVVTISHTKDEAPDFCGGVVTVTMYYKDQCVNSSVTRSFGIGSDPVYVTKNGSDYVGEACDFTDTAGIVAAYLDWLTIFQPHGGCAKTLDDYEISTGVEVPDDLPGLCGGTVTVVYTASSKICPGTGSDTKTGTFTINAPPFTLTKPDDFEASACDYTDQSGVDAEFSTWLGQFSVSGGCDDAEGEFAEQYEAPDLCGGSVVVTYNYTSRCEEGSVTRTFTITAPEEVAYGNPEDYEESMCEFEDQAAIISAFSKWLDEQIGTITPTGGCQPVLNFDYDSNDIPAMCGEGGSITVVFTITDKCLTPIELPAIFTITPAPEFVINKPANFNEDACNYADQDAIDAAFETWLNDFEVTGGCSPVVTITKDDAPEYCVGGTVIVEYSVTDNCYSGSVTASFTINAPATVDVTGPSNADVSSCDYANQAALDAAFAAWYAQFEVLESGCNGTYTLTAATAPSRIDGGTVIVTIDAADACTSDTHTAEFKVTPVSAKLSGFLTYNSAANIPLKNIPISLLQDNDVLFTATTNNSGYYEFEQVVCGTYSVVFDYSSLLPVSGPMPGINFTDAAQVNAWFVSTKPNYIEKVRFYAGDVTNNKRLQTADAGVIQNYFMSSGQNMANFDREPWTFWRANEVIGENPGLPGILEITIAGTSPISQNFYGLVTGDFNRGYNPGGSKTDGNVILKHGSTIEVNTDAVLELPVYAGNAMNIGSASLILNIPSDKIEVQGISLSHNPEVEVSYNVMGDELRIGWFTKEAISVEKDQSLFVLQLRLVNTSIDDVIALNLVPHMDNELSDGAYSPIENAVLEVDVIKAGSIITPEASMLSISAQPNPFNERTMITYSLPYDGEVIIEVTNLLGERIATLVNESQKSDGRHTISLDGANLKPGVYFATLIFKTDEASEVKTIKLIRQQ